MRPLHCRVKETFPLGKARRSWREGKGACLHAGGEARRRRLLKGDHLQPALHAGPPTSPTAAGTWCRANDTQYSPNVAVQPCPPIKTNKQSSGAEDAPRAQRAAGPATAEHNDGGSGGARAPGSRCTWLGAGKGPAWCWQRPPSRRAGRAELFTN